MAKKEYLKSLDNYQIVLKIELKNKKALLGKGLVLIELDKFKDALEIINIYVKEVPNDEIAIKAKTNSLIGIGYSYLDKKDFNSALLQFNSAIEIESNNVSALKGKIASLIGKGNNFIKIEEYDTALNSI